MGRWGGRRDKDCRFFAKEASLHFFMVREVSTVFQNFHKQPLGIDFSDIVPNGFLVKPRVGAKITLYILDEMLCVISV